MYLSIIERAYREIYIYYILYYIVVAISRIFQ